MHQTNDAEIAVLSRFVQNANERQRIKEEDIAFFYRIKDIKKDSNLKKIFQNDLSRMKIRSENVKERPAMGKLKLGDKRSIPVIEFLGVQFMLLHFGKYKMKNLKKCKKITYQMKEVFHLIRTYNNNHPDRMRLVYSLADEEKVDKKILEKVYAMKNKIYRLAFLKEMEERVKNYREKQIHEMRSNVHGDGSDCVCGEPKKGFQKLQRSLFRKSKSKAKKRCRECEFRICEGIKKSNELFEQIREERQKKRKEIREKIREEVKRTLDQI